MMHLNSTLGERSPERTARALTMLLVGYNLLLAGIWLDLSAKSTGNFINVDAGNAQSFTR